MTVGISKEAVNLREQLGQQKPQTRRTTFPFTGNGSTTAFATPLGWKPFAVYSAGLRKREGSGNDYTLTSDGFVWTVTFAVAPSTVFIEIDAEESQ